jgi:hypothetical protein
VAKTVVADLDAILPHFASYPTFKKALGITRSAAPPREHSEGEDGTLAAPQGQPDALDSVELFKKSHCNTKASFVAVNFLCDLLGGLCDDKLKTLVKNQSFKDINWTMADIDVFKELVRQLDMQRPVVNASNNFLPVASSRVLRRYASDQDGDDVEESEMMRERAEAARRCDFYINHTRRVSCTGGTCREQNAYLASMVVTRGTRLRHTSNVACQRHHRSSLQALQAKQQH